MLKAAAPVLAALLALLALPTPASAAENAPYAQCGRVYVPVSEVGEPGIYFCPPMP